MKKQGKVIWMTGLSGAGKTTIAKAAEKQLRESGEVIIRLDGDTMRDIFPGTGFKVEDRNEHIRRMGKLASLLADGGATVICSFINPFEESRSDAMDEFGNSYLVFVKCSLDECIQRDVKGLYEKAIKGEIPDFTGVSQRFDEPERADLVIETDKESLDESVRKLLDLIEESP